MLPEQPPAEEAEMTAVRHGHSGFNEFQDRLNSHPLYQRFDEAYEYDPESMVTVRLARDVYNLFKYGIPEREIPLSVKGLKQMETVGRHLSKYVSYPHFVLCAPHRRHVQGYQQLTETWPELNRAVFFPEPLLQEQDHGIVAAYPNWKVFLALHPHERREKEAFPWDYAYPNGKSIRALQKCAETFVFERLPMLQSLRLMLLSSQFPITMIRAIMCGGGLQEFDRINREEKLENGAIAVFKRLPDPRRAKLLRWNMRLYAHNASVAA